MKWTEFMKRYTDEEDIQGCIETAQRPGRCHRAAL